MSAYLCEPAEFVALARYAKRPCNGFNGYNIFTKERIGGEDGELNVRDLAMELATANIASVAYRYPREPFGGFLKDEEALIEFYCEIAQEARENRILPATARPSCWPLRLSTKAVSDLTGSSRTPTGSWTASRTTRVARWPKPLKK